MTTPLAISPWLVVPRPQAQARLRLFCFSYAGGNAMVFRTWPNDLPPEIEVCAIQLPGRDPRLREPMISRLDDLLPRLAQELEPYMQMPFAFYGHSMGALIAFELTRSLRRRRLNTPAHLLITGRPAPQLSHPSTALHDLPDAEFIEQLQRRYNAIPQAILAEPELMQLFLPVLRADFALLERYVYQAEEPLDCPIFAGGGLSDHQVSGDMLQAWRAQTRSSFTLRMFPGDHFFLRPAQAKLIQAIVQDLTRTMALLGEG